MAIVKHSTKIVYKNVSHPAGEPITIDDADFEEFEKLGVAVIKAPAVVTPPPPAPKTPRRTNR